MSELNLASHKTNFSWLVALMLIPSVLLVACNDDEGPMDSGPGDEELITSVQLSFMPVMAPDGDEFVLKFTDLDGPGGNAPVIEGDTLMANTAYSFALSLSSALDTQGEPLMDVNAEVTTEGVDHQVFYSVPGDLGTFIVLDTDADGNPLGLRGTFQAGSTGNGTVSVILRHEPNKTASGVADGDITNAGGETDVEVNFPLVIQ